VTRSHQDTTDQPSIERRCRVCRHTQVTVDGRGTDHTCATCLGEVRTNLTAIWTYSAQLLGEAIVRGIQSQAAVLAGPSADPETWNRRAILVAKAAAYADAHTPAAAALKALIEDNLDEPHPGWVLHLWELTIRNHLNQPTDKPRTISDARAYIHGHLTRLAHDPDFPFDELARALDHCRKHVEGVLHDGEQIERGAPCQRCRKPLERRTLDDGRIEYTCTTHGTLSENQYRLAVQAEHRAQADRLNADDMADRTGIKASTIRSWANVRRIQRRGEDPVEYPPLLRSCGVDSKGRKVYRVSEVLRVLQAGGDTRGRVTPVTRQDAAIVSTDGAA
jgi:hypothetical protein